MATLDYWFDYSCPYAYLGSLCVEGVAARTGARLRWQPMLLGGVFRAVGTPQNLSNVLAPAKMRHNAADMTRWADLLGVPLTMPAGHPLRTVEALRATLLSGIDPAVIHGFFRAYWVEGAEPSDRAVVRRVLQAAGHDAGAIEARLDDEGVKRELRERTDRAIAIGVFGAPAMTIDEGPLYWGQDRLALVERALGGATTMVDGAPHPSRGTMAHTLEIYWDFSSPYAYLGSTQAEALAARTGATLIWRPMLLGGLFRAIGQVDAPIATFSPAKQRHVMLDMNRWAEHWGVPFRFPSRFPMNTVKALRAYLALPDERRAGFRARTFEAYWAHDRDIADDAVLRELIGEGADEVLARTQAPEIKQALIDATSQAVAAGVFGAPTWVVDGTELFWGQDRLALVERALTR